ncbi:MAG: peptidoglycan DD-metalloendopeptidase family protein, partial [Patescibacteria group bacterium]
MKARYPLFIFWCFFVMISATVFAAIILKLPFKKDEEQVITRAYNDSTHVGKDRFALDFTIGGCDGWDSEVLSIADGKVITAETGHEHGEKGSYGNQVVVEHEDGIESRYAHLNQVLVEVGDKVGQGQQIGTAGNTGNVVGTACKEYPGTHLHFVMYQKDEDGKLQAYKPEPISGCPEVVAGKSCTSDNTLYDPNKTEIESTVNVPPEIKPQPQPSSLLNRIKLFFLRLFSNEKKEETKAEQIAQVAGGDQANESEEKAPTAPTLDALTDDLKILNTPQNITVIQGETEIPVVVQARNTGSKDWTQSEISVNVVGGLELNKIYRHPTWLTGFRPAKLDQARAAFGEIGTFTTLINLPQEAGIYQFRLQVVRQESKQFLQVGNLFYTLNIAVAAGGNAQGSAGSTGRAAPSIGERAKEAVEKVIDTTRGVVEEVIKEVRKAIENLPILWNSPSSNSSLPSVDNVQNEEKKIEKEAATSTPDIIALPEIAITFPTSTPYISAASSTMITGVFSSSTFAIYVNGSSGDIAMNTSTYTWNLPLTLAETTTTLSFVGWNHPFTTSTPTTTIKIIYSPPSPEPKPVELAGLIITSPVASSTYYASSTPIVVSGTKEENITAVVLVANSTTVTSTNMTSSTWSFGAVDLEEGEQEFGIVGYDALGNHSPTSTITIILDSTPPTVEITGSETDEENRTILMSYSGTDASGIESYTVKLSSPIFSLEDAVGCIEIEGDITFIDELIEIGSDELPLESMLIPECVWYVAETSETSVSTSFADRDSA